VAVGLPDELKGEQLWAYVVTSADAAPSEALRAELVALVAEQLGKSFRPAGIRFVRALPKTRSAKVVRRVVRAVATGTDPGDLSSLEDASTLDSIREAS
jgi:acetyl-CoA synthetase